MLLPFQVYIIYDYVVIVIGRITIFTCLVLMEVKTHLDCLGNLISLTIITNGILRYPTAYNAFKVVYSQDDTDNVIDIGYRDFAVTIHIAIYVGLG